MTNDASTIADLAPSDRYRRLAERFTAVVDAVPDDRWGSPSPCLEWTARDVVEHVVQSQRGYAEGAGEQLPAGPDVATDPVGAWHATREVVQALLDDRDRAGRVVEGRMGSASIEATMGRFHCVDLVVHGWDLASAAGTDDQVPSAELAWVRAQVEELSDMARQPGGFGPEVEAPEGADETAATMAFLGRRA